MLQILNKTNPFLYIARMKDKIEQEQELLMKREELRILRQQEAEDRKWRKQELVNCSNNSLIG